MNLITPLIIEKTLKTPSFIFDPANDLYEISGRSLPENVVKTYEPVLKWLNDNMDKINKELILVFKIDYLNSASTKMIDLILQKLEDFYNAGKKIKIEWYYADGDEDIKDEGELYARMRKLPISILALDEDED